MYLCHFNYHFVLIVLTQHRQGSFLPYPKETHLIII